jgi:hypothetical protein
MKEIDLQYFIDNYSKDDFEKIRFDWNGKYGNEFHDNNYDFRMSLCEFLLPEIETANIELVRDLYSETTKSSKATWSIYTKIHIYAQELLRRNWKKYLHDYMRGGSYGMDSFIAIARVEIDKTIARQILDHINETIKTTPDQDEKRLMSGYLNRFQWLADK